MSLPENLSQVIIETIQELSSVHPVFKANRDMFYSYFFDTFKLTFKLIDYIKSDSQEIIEMNKVKKDKQYIKKYINAFELNIHYQQIIHDAKAERQTIVNKYIFKLYLENKEQFYKIRTATYNFKISNPEIAKTIKILKERRARTHNFTKKERVYIEIYEFFTYCFNALKFFRCHDITEKNIITSLSIILYKHLTKTDFINKSKAKNILETMFYKLDISTIIRPEDMDYIIVKTMVNGLTILAYPSSNGKPSPIDFEKVITTLKKKIDKHKNIPRKAEELQHYLDSNISPVNDFLKP